MKAPLTGPQSARAVGEWMKRRRQELGLNKFEAALATTVTTPDGEPRQLLSEAQWRTAEGSRSQKRTGPFSPLELYALALALKTDVGEVVRVAGYRI